VTKDCLVKAGKLKNLKAFNKIDSAIFTQESPLRSEIQAKMILPKKCGSTCAAHQTPYGEFQSTRREQMFERK